MDNQPKFQAYDSFVPSSARMDNQPRSKLRAIGAPKHTAVVACYEDACQNNPELEVLNGTLHKCTDQVIKTHAKDKVPASSFGVFGEVFRSLGVINQEVLKLLLDCGNSTWNDEELRELVKEYHIISNECLEFCTRLRGCVRSTHTLLFELEFAIQSTQGIEVVDDDGKKSSRTLKESLEAFNAAKDPFKELIASSYELVCKKFASLLQKLGERRQMLEKRINSSMAWRKGWTIIFAGVFASAVIVFTAAAVILESPVAVSATLALVRGGVSVFEIVNSVWKNFEEELKKKRDIVSSIEACTTCTMDELRTIKSLVNDLVEEIKSLPNIPDFDLINKNAVKLVIDKIKNNLSTSKEDLDNLRNHAVTCSRLIEKGKQEIWKKLCTPGGAPTEVSLGKSS